jgi:thiosulfate reductase/polysulfide reductase chain A
VASLRNNPEGLRATPLAFEKFRTQDFTTPSGKVEFFSERLNQAGHLAVPFKDGDTANPISFADAMGQDALIGISGERTNRFTHTQFHNISWLNQGEKTGTVDLHPEDARARNIKPGQWLTLSSPRGVVRMKAKISEAVHPGVIRIAWGWGEVDPQANVNNLTDDHRRDPVTGTPSNRSFMCRIES